MMEWAVPVSVLETWTAWDVAEHVAYFGIVAAEQSNAANGIDPETADRIEREVRADAEAAEGDA